VIKSPASKPRIATATTVTAGTLNLPYQFTDDQLAATAAGVVSEQPAGDFFAGRAEHAAEHIASVEEGLRQGA